MIQAHTFTTSGYMLRDDSSTKDTRQEMPPIIIPPLPKTGCEELRSLADIQVCNGNFQDVITITACVGAGLIIVPGIFFITWTVVKWMRAVRSKKTTIVTGMEAKNNVTGSIGSGYWGKAGGNVQGFPPSKRALVGGGNFSRAGAKKGNAKMEEKDVWYDGVRITLPWGRGQKWDRAVS